MSEQVAKNTGFVRVLDTWEMLNKGADLKVIANILGCSESRASRKIHAMFERVWTPKPGTKKMLDEAKEKEAWENTWRTKRLADVEIAQAVIIPFEQYGKHGKDITQENRRTGKVRA